MPKPHAPGHRADVIRAAPTFVQRAISAVRPHDKRVSNARLRFQLSEAERVVAEFLVLTKQWIADVDAKIGRQAENLDIENSTQVAELLKAPNLKMLEKKRLREAVVDAVQLQLKDLRRAVEARERHDDQRP